VLAFDFGIIMCSMCRFWGRVSGVRWGGADLWMSKEGDVVLAIGFEC
jgi:hypothetical protein